MSDFELVWDSRCGVAESPVWDAATRRLLFCDIPGMRINALSVDDGTRTSWELPEVVGSFGLCLSGRLVVALRHRVVLFDPRTGEIDNLTEPVDEPPTNRLNDGKVGPDGCFWVGSMDERPQREKRGALYRVTPDGRIERKAEGYAVSNGLAWSPDGRTMYHSDSTAGTIEAWDFDADSGRLSNHRLLATLTSEEGRPDGAAVDLEGAYWSAGPSAGVHQPLLAAGQAAGEACIPGARADDAVLRRAPPLCHVAARGQAGGDAAAASDAGRTVPHRCTGPGRAGRCVWRYLTCAGRRISPSRCVRVVPRRRLVIAGRRGRGRIIRRWRGPRRGDRTADCADTAADQRTGRGTASATGQTADRRSRPGAEHAATHSALARIIRVGAGRQGESQSERGRGGCDQTLHDTVISYRVLVFWPVIHPIVTPNETPGEY